MPSLGRNPLRQNLVDWADLILVMEPHHSHFIHAHFRCDPRKVRVLDISDNYRRDDPQLIKELERKVSPILQMEDKLREIREQV
jgi:predicted protein tyrosine phosphatase